MNTTKAATAADADYLGELPLNIFAHCLSSGDYSRLTGYKPFFTEHSFIDSFNSLPNSARLLATLKDGNFLKWKMILSEYLARVGCNNERELVKCFSRGHSLYVGLVTAGAMLEMLKYGYSHSAAKSLTDSYLIKITPDNMADSLPEILALCEKEIKQYNRLCAEYHLLKPNHNTPYFLGVIRKVQDQHKIFPGGTKANNIFNRITVGEFVEYVNSIKADG